MIFVDANIFMYAIGSESAFKKSCQDFLEKSLTSHKPVNKLFIDSEILQEILHRYFAIGKKQIGIALFEKILSLQIEVLPVELSDLLRAKDLLLQFPSLSTRDAVHAGVCQGQGIERVLSYDRDFSLINWLKREEP